MCFDELILNFDSLFIPKNVAVERIEELKLELRRYEINVSSMYRYYQFFKCLLNQFSNRFFYEEWQMKEIPHWKSEMPSATTCLKTFHRYGFFWGAYKIDLACKWTRRAKEGNKQLNFSVKKKSKTTAYVLHISSIFYD